jgi:predicted Ser/Thr protein kinase
MKVTVAGRFEFSMEDVGLLGKGAFGRVFRCTDTATNTELAIKLESADCKAP